MPSQKTPRKRFGQNFLKDNSVINKIFESIPLNLDDIVIEIGPGLGAITKNLIKKLNHLYAIEIDSDIVALLKKQFTADQLTLYCQDALKFNFSSIHGFKKIIGNLPYNISTPLLFYFIEFSDQIKSMHFMLQKEVASRLVAKPSTSDYGRLSVLMQYDFLIEPLFDISPSAFWPEPKIHSTFVRMIPLPDQHGTVKDKIIFKKIVTTAFNQRRKTLRNSLKTLINVKHLEKNGINPTARAENISISEFVRLTNDYIDNQSLYTN